MCACALKWLLPRLLQEGSSGSSGGPSAASGEKPTDPHAPGVKTMQVSCRPAAQSFQPVHLLLLAGRNASTCQCGSTPFDLESIC